jgi:GH35 family endo-1,4-beta-xylanase
MICKTDGVPSVAFRSPREWRLIQAFLLSACLLQSLAPQAIVPPGGSLLLSGVADAVQDRAFSIGNLEVVPVNGTDFSKALRFSISKAGKSWDAAINLAIPREIAKGEVILISYWARTVSTTHESGQGSLQVKLEEFNGPYRGILSDSRTFSGEWTRRFARGAAPFDFKKGSIALKIFAGTMEQVVDVGGIEILSYGTNVDIKSLPVSRLEYPGSRMEAPWRREAQKRIADFRMAPITLLVQDKQGRSVGNASVRIEMIRNDFQFGTVYDAWRISSETNEAVAFYREQIPKLFNAFVLGNDLKWEAWIGEWQPPKYTRSQTLHALRWAKSNDLFVRGHCMVWPGRVEPGREWEALPRFMRELRGKVGPEVIQGHVLAHIDSLAHETAGLVDEWDVVNEVVDKYALVSLCGTNAMVDWFRRARARLPGVLLAINDYSILTAINTNVDPNGHQSKYFRVIKDLLAAGAPIDMIGMQGYFGNDVPSPMRMLQTLDRFAELGPRLRVTEYSIKAEDDGFKADFTRDLLTVLYSHEKVSGFTTWHGIQNFIGTNGVLTPMGKAYHDLACVEWKTTTNLKSDIQGRCSLRGHRGMYRVVASHLGKSSTQNLNLSKEGADWRVILD